MFNKKLQIAVIIILIILGISVTFNGETYNILNIFGVQNQLYYYIYINVILIVFVGYVLFIIYMRKLIIKKFYTYMYRTDYDMAKELIEKYFKQNKGLFICEYAFFKLSIKDKKSLLEMCDHAKGKKNFYIKVYLTFIDFLNDECTIQYVSELIEESHLYKIKNNTLNLIYAIENFLLNNKFQVIDYCNKITEEYHFPIIKEILFKLQNL